ncbi:MAG TPA: hypothetical protein VN611_08120 [Patescibacteria group bacterium]|nr:hypothetical protein [Patescibacteria group bacterium]
MNGDDSLNPAGAGNRLRNLWGLDGERMMLHVVLLVGITGMIYLRTGPDRVTGGPRDGDCPGNPRNQKELLPAAGDQRNDLHFKNCR